MIDEENIEPLFIDVRRAYRLLFSYQKQVLELVKYIGDQYNCSYEGGYAKFSNPSPRNGQGNLLSWSWDWLNMYLYQFTFSPHVQSNGETVFFSIILQSDTGYFDADLDGKEGKRSPDRCDLHSFMSAEESKTLLHLVVGKSSASVDNVKNIRKHMRLKTEELAWWDDKKQTMSKAYLLSSFLNEEQTLHQLQDFRELCSNHFIELPRALNQG